MAIKCVSFDLDHTLWDVDPVIVQANHEMLMWLAKQAPEFGHSYLLKAHPALVADFPLSSLATSDHPVALELVSYLSELRDRVLKAYPEIGFSVSQIRWHMLNMGLLEAGYQGESLKCLTDAAFEVFLQARRKVTLFAKTLPMLTQVQSMGLDTLALTNGNACIEAAGLDQHISTLYCADDLGVMKPHPDSFKRAFEQHGVAHSEVIHVGDNLVDDIQGARSAGVASIWVNLVGHPLPNDLLDVRLIDQHRPSVGRPVMVTDLLQIPTVVAWMKDRL